MIPAVSLSAEPANITAIANDIGTEAIFARQLIAHARPEDVAIGISTSGGSANILSALAEARKRGLLTVGIVGYDGGRIVGERLADHAVVVRSDYIPRIQEVQASIYHILEVSWIETAWKVNNKEADDADRSKSEVSFALRAADRGRTDGPRGRRLVVAGRRHPAG